MIDQSYSFMQNMSAQTHTIMISAAENGKGGFHSPQRIIERGVYRNRISQAMRISALQIGREETVHGGDGRFFVNAFRRNRNAMPLLDAKTHNFH